MKTSMKFAVQAGKQMHRPGVYRISHRGAGVVMIKTADGAAVGIQNDASPDGQRTH